METIQKFNHPQFGEIRTMVNENNEPWFVGKDVATILGYSAPRNALAAHVDDEDKTNASIQCTGSNYKSQAVLINESGLYSLILSSKLPQAKEFKHWVTAEVLPQIRKTGGYIPTASPDPSRRGEMTSDNEILSRALLIAQRTIELKNNQLAEQKPLVQFAEAITSADDSILIRDLAKLIAQNGVAIGQGRLFYWLRLHGYLFKRETRPIQEWVEKGIFDTNVTTVHTHHGLKERITTKVTGKGQRYFIEGFTSGRFRYKNGEL